MNYREYFRIEIEHGYYSNNRNSELRIVPTLDSEQMLQRRQLIMKYTGNDIRILIPVDGSGNVKHTLDQTLTFEVFPGTEHFREITDTDGLSAEEFLHFSNTGLEAAETALHATPAQEAGPRPGLKMVARIGIEPTPTLIAASESISYRVVFQARSEKWRYYFVSDQETTSLSIVDLEERLTFNQVDLSIPNADQIGTALQTRFPEARLFLFESASPIVGKDEALRNLQLIRDDHVIVKHLPNPDIGDAATKIIKIQKPISNQ